LLKTLPPDRELGVAYANLSELAVTRGDAERTIVWGQRALALALEFDDSETPGYADVCIGAIEAERGDPAGSAKLERVLESAIDAGFEEVAASPFDCIVRAAVRARSFAAVDRYLARGVEYCSERELGTWRQSLVALGARADLDRGRWDDAAARAEIAWLRGEPAAVPPATGDRRRDSIRCRRALHALNPRRLAPRGRWLERTWLPL
jgi:hypothetical protein